MDNSDLNDSLPEKEYPEIIEEKYVKQNGDEVIKRYKRLQFLGKGGFAKCYEFECLNNNKIYAIKIVNKSTINKSSAKQKLKSEIKIHKSLFHKHIVKFEHVFEDNDHVFILLELCKNKTLSDVMKKRKIINEFEARYYLSQILKAVNFMHKNKIIHRDLKLGNLFLDEGMNVKIGDFGLATIIEFSGQLRYTVCGTPNYIAPEILEGKNSGHSYEVDIWAIGVILYTMLVGKPPFETEDVKETYKKIKNIEFTYPTNIYVSEEAKDLINKLLKLNPMERLKIDEIKQHPFMTKINPPKELPDSSGINPLSSTFMMNYFIELNFPKNEDLIKLNPADISNYLKKNDEKNNYEVIADYLKKEVIHINDKNILDRKFILSESEIQNYINNNHKTDYIIKRSSSNNLRNKDIVMNMKYLTNYNELSFSKEFSNTLTKREDFNETSLPFEFLIHIVDLGEGIGLGYLTNKSYAGIIYKKQCLTNSSPITLFKNINDSKLFIRNGKSELSDKSNYNQSIKKKTELFEDLIIEFKQILNEIIPSKIDLLNTNPTYPIDYFKSNLAYFIRLSNDMTHLFFYDFSKLIIGNNDFPYIVFINKESVISSTSIHNVNKTDNKNLLKRYDHYKKIFYEKLDEYNSNRDKQKSIDNNDNIENDDEEIEAEENEDSKDSPEDLNKTL